MGKRIRYILGEIKSSRATEKHLQHDIHSNQGGILLNRQILKVDKTLSAKRKRSEIMSERLKRANLFLMETIMKTAKTISELKRLRKLAVKMTLRVRQGPANEGKVVTARLKT